MISEIGDSVYQIGIRTVIPNEVNETDETTKSKEKKVPLIRSSKPEAVHANISEMVRAGHPKNQAVAAAMNVARKAGKKHKAKKK
jgi:hypothetical protein